MKSYITMMVAVVFVAVCIWLRLHHNNGLARLAARPAAAAPVIMALSNPAPQNLSKVITVTGRPVAIPSPALSLSGASWQAIQIIVDSSVDFEQRSKAVDSLPARLTDDDWDALQKFLTTADSGDKEQAQQSIKNQLMDVLCAIDPPPAEWGNMLVQIYRDKKQDAVLRDYAVQHLAAYYEQMEQQPDSARALQRIQNVLWDAVGETEGSIGGTALLALKRLSQEQAANFDQTKIMAAAVRMAGDDRAGELTHMTAFQVCADLRVADALPVVIQAAQAGETIPVRMSAIGALGQLGGRDEISWLKNVIDGAEDRLKPAARHALEQIIARQHLLAGQNNPLSNP